MSNIHDGKKFRDRAVLLREQAALHGITLVPGEADRLLADRLSAVAGQMGISERWALDNYVTGDFVVKFARSLARHAETYDQAVSEIEPVGLTIAETARVLAATGMALKLAAGHVELTMAESMAMLTDGADFIVGIGAAMSAADGSGQVELGGQILVWIRSILVRTIDLLRSGTWTCPCEGTHGQNPSCTLVPVLARDLSLAGGWPSPGPAEEPSTGSSDFGQR
jgi:hypothetical protein